MNGKGKWQSMCDRACGPEHGSYYRSSKSVFGLGGDRVYSGLSSFDFVFGCGRAGMGRQAGLVGGGWDEIQTQSERKNP